MGKIQGDATKKVIERYFVPGVTIKDAIKAEELFKQYLLANENEIEMEVHDFGDLKLIFRCVFGRLPEYK